MKPSNFFSTSMLLLALCPAGKAQEEAEKNKEQPAEKTEIFSDNLVMVSRDKDNHFLFTGNVEIRATNMVATCERLEVYAGKKVQANSKTPTVTKDGQAPIGKIDKILALGGVRLVQQDRVATAGKAEIYPQKGMVVLLDSPVVTDPQGSLSGYRITLIQGEQKVLVESGPGQRPKITLPQIPDLGIDGKKKAIPSPP